MGIFTNSTKQEIFKGDRVEIKAMGMTVVGTCDSVQFHGDQYGIELTTDAGRAHYWKQWADGGSVKKIS